MMMMMTTSQSAEATIRAFLALPAEAMPSAKYMPPWHGNGNGNAWPQLRDYIRPGHLQRINHLGETIRLIADRDEWRDGVTVRLLLDVPATE